MPGMNGLDVQNQLRGVQPKLPVIFITAHDDFNVRECALAGGAVAYLRKPFNDATFSQTLDAALKETGK